ncbi:DnaJ domain-containing protein [Kaistia adipata]|uniref:DnaJ domain-containing protein n=1 Tax=Kaistia adipata TaxID=166954 RepID=UPI0003FFBC73|nr:DnaJ domain-containing protein [Kaistia adipata]
MADKRSLYTELDVAPGATPAEIDKAYRQRARTAHPDAGGSSEAFHKLSHAYAVLSDPERRKAYDETGYEGELAADDIVGRAMERIQALVVSVLESDLPFEQVDLIAPIRDTLTKQKSDVGAGIRKLEKQAKRAEAMAARFRRQSGDNIIRKSLERRAADTREMAEKTRREEAVFAKAIELLADYSFDFEPPPKPAAPPRPPEAAKPAAAPKAPEPPKPEPPKPGAPKPGSRPTLNLVR